MLNNTFTINFCQYSLDKKPTIPFVFTPGFVAISGK